MVEKPTTVGFGDFLIWLLLGLVTFGIYTSRSRPSRSGSWPFRATMSLARPFEWTFNRQDSVRLLANLADQPSPAVAASTQAIRVRT